MLTLLGIVGSQTESYFYSSPKTASYDQFLPNASAGLILNYVTIPNGSKRLPQRGRVCGDSPVPCKPRCERDLPGSGSEEIRRPKKQQKRALCRWLRFLNQKQWIYKMRTSLIPQPKYQPNRGCSFMKEQGNIFKILATHQRGNLAVLSCSTGISSSIYTPRWQKCICLVLEWH